ncbi:uncharacterized protein LOC130625338 [Hydractinia symbiolongicarpus]|uniref:uncharacterized protein LOC130625338 n=1 Tax=Hydractinia symbiolongicarpus TaxID=13093 RepID=UPI00254A3C4C|nr:uncharacterized protein LOC130625338 [Hydractinia symbiolongicarpus]XP_057296399.1 uncharacterized protein LOC130625338 [Hydractinia symbiolongicarpus]
MKLLFAVLCFVQIGIPVVANVSCKANAKHIVFTAPTDVNMFNMTLYVRLIGEKKWIYQPGCTSSIANKLVCPNKLIRNAPYLNIKTTQKTGTNTTTTDYFLWLYKCYINHGVKQITITQNAWDGFEIKWNHYSWDDKFIHTDRVIVKNKNKSHSSDVTKQMFRFSKVHINNVYNICIETTFPFSEKKFLNITNQVMSRCISITTPKKHQQDESSNLKTPLVAVGIGIVLLVMLCIIFVVYNKKCKQGGDHDYDMNQDEALAAGDKIEDVEMQEDENSEKEVLTTQDNEEH